MSSFADDTKLGLGIKSTDDAWEMQESLEEMYKWQERNNMEFNATKFQVLHLGKGKIHQEYNYFNPNYDSPIIPSNSVKDLGVYIDSDFSYRTHVDEICKKNKEKGRVDSTDFQVQRCHIYEAHMESLYGPKY